jgi:esterase
MVAKSPQQHIHFTRTGSGPAVILLHGLFGTGGNLGALARALAGDYTVYSPDLPNHGRSAWVAAATLANLASAIDDWMGQLHLDSAAIVGHSLGGKIGMELALTRPQRVTALAVADIAPAAYPPHHDAVFAALDAVHGAGMRSRAEAAALMREHLQEEGVIHFLLMSLKRNDDGCYSWRFNLEGLKRDYGAVRAAPDGNMPFNGPVLFIKGGVSDYILPQHRTTVLRLFPGAELKVMPDCGHWLHAEQPALFNSIVRRFLQRSLSGGE